MREIVEVLPVVEHTAGRPSFSPLFRFDPEKGLLPTGNRPMRPGFLASSLGMRARTALEWLKLAYDTVGEDLHEAIHNQPGYYGIKAPPTLNHRYIFEDIPMSLVPMASLGERYGVSVRGMDAIIRLACIVHRTDYWRRGRTLDKLGINNLSVGELTRYVNEGVLE